MTGQKSLSKAFAKQWISQATSCHQEWLSGKSANYQMIEEYVILGNAIDNAAITGEDSEDRVVREQATSLWNEVEEAWSLIQDNFLAYKQMISGTSIKIGGDDHAIVRQAAVDAINSEHRGLYSEYLFMPR